jgi:hypothetical protein
MCRVTAQQQQQQQQQQQVVSVLMQRTSVVRVALVVLWKRGLHAADAAAGVLVCPGGRGGGGDMSHSSCMSGQSTDGMGGHACMAQLYHGICAA